MEVQSLHNKDIDREQWDRLVHASPQGSVYALSGFLDIIYPEWWGFLAKEGKRIIAAFPVFPKQKWGIQYTFQPRFGQYQGILFGALGTSTTTREYDKKRKIVQAFAEVLQQQFKLFGQNFSPSFDYPLPFHWAGFSLNARYTYQLSLTGSEETLFEGFDKPHKRQTRKALKQGIQLAQNADPESLLTILETAMADKKDFQTTGFMETRRKLVDWALATGNGFLITLEWEKKPVSSGLFLQFHNTTYFFMGHALPEAKQAGAMYLLVWKALKQVNHKGHLFDFEGSMIHPIERFFQGFGSQPVPYLHIYKNQLPLRILWQMLGY